MNLPFNSFQRNVFLLIFYTTIVLFVLLWACNNFNFLVLLLPSIFEGKGGTLTRKVSISALSKTFEKINEDYNYTCLHEHKENIKENKLLLPLKHIENSSIWPIIASLFLQWNIKYYISWSPNKIIIKINVAGKKFRLTLLNFLKLILFHNFRHYS